MKKILFQLSLVSLIPLCSFAAIDGVLLNRTTNKPAANVTVTLVKPGAQGMQTIGSTKSDARGHYRFEKDQPGGGPQLIQASYQGVNYNKLLTPNLPTSNVQVDVFEMTKSPAPAKIAQHMVVLEPSAGQLGVIETFILNNESNTTYFDPKLGGIRITLPTKASTQARANVRGPGGMPLPHPIEKTEKPDVYRVSYAIKPGETQIEVSYTLADLTEPITFSGKIAEIPGQPPGPVRLVAPQGVTLEGNDVRQLGQEPSTKASIYDLVALAGFSVKVNGMGTLRSDANNGATSADGDSPQIETGLPAVYRHLLWLIALAFAVLTVGFFLLWRTPAEH